MASSNKPCYSSNWIRNYYKKCEAGPGLLLKFSYVRGRGKIPDLYSYKLYIRSKGAQKAFLSSVSNSLFVARIIVRNV